MTVCQRWPFTNPEECTFISGGSEFPAFCIWRWSSVTKPPSRDLSAQHKSCCIFTWCVRWKRHWEKLRSDMKCQTYRAMQSRHFCPELNPMPVSHEPALTEAQWDGGPRGPSFIFPTTCRNLYRPPLESAAKRPLPPLEIQCRCLPGWPEHCLLENACRTIANALLIHLNTSIIENNSSG